MILGIIGGSLFSLLETGTLQITSAGADLTILEILVAALGALVAIYL